MSGSPRVPRPRQPARRSRGLRAGTAETRPAGRGSPPRSAGRRDAGLATPGTRTQPALAGFVSAARGFSPRLLRHARFGSRLLGHAGALSTIPAESVIFSITSSAPRLSHSSAASASVSRSCSDRPSALSLLYPSASVALQCTIGSPMLPQDRRHSSTNSPDRSLRLLHGGRRH